jgi:hypothetical protein
MVALMSCLLSTPAVAHAGDELGHLAALPTLNPGVLVDAVAGEGPSTGHPRGTAIVAASLAACGPSLLEWDVALQRVVRQACLGLPLSDMRLARAGGTLQVLANGQSRILKEVDAASFRVEHTLDLGVGSYTGVASDGALTVVASAARSDQARGTWEAATVDASGRLLGRLRAPGALSGHVELAVLAGRAFVVLNADPPRDLRARLVALRTDATIAKEIPLDGPTEHPSLAVRRNRLLLATGDEILELSPDLDVLARHPASLHGSLAVSRDGHILTGNGEIVTDAFTPERYISPGEGWVHAVLWLGSTPIIVGSGAEVVRHARIHWWDSV